VHVTLLLILPLLSRQFAPGEGHSAMLWGFVGAVTLFASVALHELGHSVAAIRLGYKVRDITLWPIGGVAMLATMPSRPLHEFIIAIAGPLVSLALGIVGLVCGPLLWRLGLDNPGYVFIYVLGILNLVLFAFNLIPAFPMDGGRVLRAALSVKLGRLTATRIASRIGRFLAVAFGIYAAMNGLILSVIIAIFIYSAAGQEYRMVQMQEMMRWNPVFDWFGRPSGPPPIPPDVTVGPPPYRR
jgi:Zn-dependent protease